MQSLLLSHKIGIIFALAIFLAIWSYTSIGRAEAREDMSITISNSTFAPLSNVHGNQVTVAFKYLVNDQSLENEKINGVMKLYANNGTLIHTSSFPDGFTAKKKGGTEELKHTIKDQTVKTVLANVTLTDLKKTQSLSNSVTSKLDLKQPVNHSKSETPT